MANSRKKVHLYVILEIFDFDLSICVTGKNLRLSFDMRHRAIGAGGEFFFVDTCPLWACLEVPVAIGLCVFGDDHPRIVLL